MHRGWGGRDRFGASVAIVGRFDVIAFCEWLGIEQQDYDTIESAMRNSRPRGTLDGLLVDKVLTGAGEPETYLFLYIVTFDGQKEVR